MAKLKTFKFRVTANSISEWDIVFKRSNNDLIYIRSVLFHGVWTFYHFNDLVLPKIFYHFTGELTPKDTSYTGFIDLFFSTKPYVGVLFYCGHSTRNYFEQWALSSRLWRCDDSMDRFSWQLLLHCFRRGREIFYFAPHS